MLLATQHNERGREDERATLSMTAPFVIVGAWLNLYVGRTTVWR